MRAITFWMWKGGSGKTTCTVNLAAALAERGARILIVDLDPQGSATRLLGDLPVPGILDAIRGDLELEELTVPTSARGIDLVPAGPELVRAERILHDELGGAERLAEIFLELPDHWDYVCIDCPPGLGALSIGALLATPEHIAVIDPRPLSVAGLADAVEFGETAHARGGGEATPSRLLLSRMLHSPSARVTEEEIRARFAARVFAAGIPECAALVEASARQEPILDYAPDHPASEAFRSLAGELDQGAADVHPGPVPTRSGAIELREPREPAATSALQRGELLNWMNSHPDAVHGDPVEILRRCETEVQRYASEDAWLHAKAILEDSSQDWAGVFAAADSKAIDAQQLCHELAEELRAHEPTLEEGEEDRLAGSAVLRSLEPEARDLLRRWLRDLAREQEHRAWLEVVDFTDTRARSLPPEQLSPDPQTDATADILTRILSHDYEEHARHALRC